MRRSPWLDPADVRSAVALALIAAAANAIWIFLDNSTPSYDQSSYMNVTIAFRDALQNGGPSDLFQAIRDTDPARGPLFTVLILPFVLLFGDGLLGLRGTGGHEARLSSENASTDAAGRGSPTTTARNAPQATETAAVR